MIRLGLVVALAVAFLVSPVAGIGVLVGWGLGDLIVAMWRLGIFRLKADEDWTDVRPERRS